jgi:ATP-dependent Clp protease ATP-binding subunit ClpC
MALHEATIELTDEAKEFLVAKGYDPAMGARPLRRAIQSHIEDPLADFVLGRALIPGSIIRVDHEEGEDEVSIEVLEPEPQLVTVPPEEPESSANGDGGQEADD